MPALAEALLEGGLLDPVSLETGYRVSEELIIILSNVADPDPEYASAPASHYAAHAPTSMALWHCNPRMLKHLSCTVGCCGLGLWSRSLWSRVAARITWMVIMNMFELLCAALTET